MFLRQVISQDATHVYSKKSVLILFYLEFRELRRIDRI
jgi:hypothetical protein